MVLIGLLLLALILVVVGVVKASVGWLIASLVVSVLAAAVLLRSFLQTRRRANLARSASPAPVDAAAAEHPASESARPAESAAATGDAALPRDAQVWVVDGYPEYHVENCGELAGLPAETVAYDQAVEDGFQPCVVCNPDRALRPAAPATVPAAPDSRHVLVIDGLPQYHVAGCRVLLGHESISIPVEQAEEDGFSPCAVCEPGVAGAATDVRRTHGREVWVVDGYPDYHREGCSTLVGLAAEPIPHEQAIEDGFAECAACTPESERDPDDAAAGAAPGRAEVWVVDGFPHYHRADCGELSGLPAEAIPHAQAVEDGFAPCPVCQLSDRQVSVVDGQPDYHRSGCERLVGLPAEPIPYHQAVEDGFAPCEVCRPDEEARPPAETAG